MSTSRAAGALVTLRVAGELSGIAPDVLISLVRSGKVRSQRIKGTVYVDLDDADRAARVRREGGRP